MRMNASIFLELGTQIHQNHPQRERDEAPIRLSIKNHGRIPTRIHGDRDRGEIFPALIKYRFM
jgi:hypothetical protein